MAFPNQNNQQKEVHVNTRGLQLFNANGFEPSTLIIGMWNQLVSLKIHPAKEKSQQTKSSVYDYDKAINIILDNKTADTLGDIILDELIPAVNECKEFTRAVTVGANSAVVVSSGVKRGGGKPIPYMAIARNIKPGVLLPEDILSYTFNPSYVLNNYDGMPGNTEFDIKTCQIPIQSELKLFGRVLKYMATALIGAEYHAARNINKRYDDNVFQFYKQLAAKYGLEFYSGSGKNYDRAPSVFGASSQASTGSFSSSMDTKPESFGGEVGEISLDAFA